MSIVFAIFLALYSARPAPAADWKAPIFRYGWAANLSGSMGLATLVVRFDGTGWIALTGRDIVRNVDLPGLTIRPVHFDLNAGTVGLGAR